MPTSFKNLGAKRSPYDYRHMIASAAADMTPQPLPVGIITDMTKFGEFDQKQEPACVSNAWAKRMKLWWYLKTGQVVDFCPRFLHIISGMKKYNGTADLGPEDGRDPAIVAKLSLTVGCATEATLVNDTTLSTVDYFNPALISQAMLDEAAQYKIPGYISVAPTQAAFRNAVIKYGAVSMLLEVGAEFWTAPNGVVSWDAEGPNGIDPIRPPKSINDIISGHETLYIGYNSLLERGDNSWSDLWDLKGEFNFIWSEWEDYIKEGWTIAELDPTTLALLQSLPPASDFEHEFVTSLSQGMTSDEVKMLQIALSIDGEFTYPEVTGYYGPLTATAVLAFQQKYQVDTSAELLSLKGSRVGPKTLAALNKIYAQGV